MKSGEWYSKWKKYITEQVGLTKDKSRLTDGNQSSRLCPKGIIALREGHLNEFTMKHCFFTSTVYPADTVDQYTCLQIAICFNSMVNNTNECLLAYQCAVSMSILLFSPSDQMSDENRAFYVRQKTWYRRTLQSRPASAGSQLTPTITELCAFWRPLKVIVKFDWSREFHSVSLGAGMITLSVHWTCCRPVTHAQTWAWLIQL